MIDSRVALCGADCCAPGACWRLLQQYLPGADIDSSCQGPGRELSANLQHDTTPLIAGDFKFRLYKLLTSQRVQPGAETQRLRDDQRSVLPAAMAAPKQWPIRLFPGADAAALRTGEPIRPADAPEIASAGFSSGNIRWNSNRFFGKFFSTRIVAKPAFGRHNRSPPTSQPTQSSLTSRSQVTPRVRRTLISGGRPQEGLGDGARGFW